MNSSNITSRANNQLCSSLSRFKATFQTSRQVFPTDWISQLKTNFNKFGGGREGEVRSGTKQEVKSRGGSSQEAKIQSENWSSEAVLYGFRPDPAEWPDGARATTPPVIAVSMMSFPWRLTERQTRQCLEYTAGRIVSRKCHSKFRFLPQFSEPRS